MLSPGKHYVNSPIRLTVNLGDAAGNDIDPTTVVFKTIDPAGGEESYTYGTDSELTRINTGDYAADITPDSAGRWLFRWETTGGAIALEGDFLVQDSVFYPWDGTSDYV